MRSRAMIVLLCGLLGGSAGAAGANVTTYTDSIQVNVTGIELYHPCADGGAGEMVALSGYLHIVIHYTLPEDGSGNFTQHYNYNSVKGVGLSTGDEYRAVGAYRFVTIFNPGDEVRVDSFVANTLIVGKGKAPNFRAHSTVHTTMNAAGEITASVDFNSTSCD